MDNNRTPVALIGAPGIGKTAAFYEFCERVGIKPYSMVCSQEDPVDICGVITCKDGKSERALPGWWKRACDEPYGILFDELTASSPEQFGATLRATDDTRELAGARLHPDTRIFAAWNPVEFAAGAARELAAPVLSRFRHRKLSAQDAISWLNGGQGIRLDFPVKPALPELKSIIGAYLRTNPTAALATGEMIKQAVEKQEPFACPRAWYRAACEEGDITLWGEYVGGGAAAGFINWFTAMDLPSAEEILAGRDKTVPQRGDGAMVVAASLAGLLGDKPADKALANAMEWFNLAAQAGHAANVAIDLRRAIGSIGVTRIAKYAKEIMPFHKMLRDAGLIR